MYDFLIDLLRTNVENLKSSAFCMAGATLSSMMDWIPVATIRDAIIVTLISAVVGFYANKALKAFDGWIKTKFNKKPKGKA